MAADKQNSRRISIRLAHNMATHSQAFLTGSFLSLLLAGISEVCLGRHWFVSAIAFMVFAGFAILISGFLLQRRCSCCESLRLVPERPHVRISTSKTLNRRMITLLVTILLLAAIAIVAGQNYIFMFFSTTGLLSIAGAAVGLFYLRSKFYNERKRRLQILQFKNTVEQLESVDADELSAIAALATEIGYVDKADFFSKIYFERVTGSNLSLAESEAAKSSFET